MHWLCLLVATTVAFITTFTSPRLTLHNANTADHTCLPGYIKDNTLSHDIITNLCGAAAVWLLTHPQTLPHYICAAASTAASV